MTKAKPITHKRLRLYVRWANRLGDPGCRQMKRLIKEIEKIWADRVFAAELRAENFVLRKKMAQCIQVLRRMVDDNDRYVTQLEAILRDDAKASMEVHEARRKANE